MSNIANKTSGQKLGYLSPEFITEREQFFVDRGGKKVWIGCGDDRSATEQSVQALGLLEPEVVSVEDGYASIFGAVAGIAKNILVVGVAQYGPAFVARIGGLDGALQKTIHGLREDDSAAAIMPALHSAESNEGSASEFNPRGTAKVGCAYAEGVGATSALLIDQNDSSIRDQARRDQIEIFGDDRHFDDLLAAHRVVLAAATHGKGKDFAVSRPEYTAVQLPIMILAGAHTSAKTSGLIHNFKPHTVRNSATANAKEKDFYSQDIADITAAALRAFREYNLDPELLMRAFVLDSTPVRAVLAAADANPELKGKLDPLNLPVGIFGSPQEAVAALQAA